MEPHQEKLYGIEQFKPNTEDGPTEYFRKARIFSETFYEDQIKEISSVNWNEISPEYFFREYCWVVHATGFSAKAVGKFMPKLLKAYGPWNKLGKEKFQRAFKRVKVVCNNPQKAKAIHRTAKLMVDELSKNSWTDFKEKYLKTPDKLAELPYIGKITCFHLGRNIGLLDCVKPDLHLVRLAKHWGFKDCIEMCKTVQPNDMPLGIVDYCFWRAASEFGTLNIKTEDIR